MEILQFMVVFFVLVIMTIRYLPFINIDAAFRLQMWAKEALRKLEELHDDLDRKSR